MAHVVVTPDSFASTAPILPLIVDSQDRVRDRASLVGTVDIDPDARRCRTPDRR